MIAGGVERAKAAPAQAERRMSIKHVVPLVVLGCAVFVASTDAGQHRWKGPARASVRAEPIRPVAIGPRASIGGGSAGVYCPDMTEAAVGVHDLGWIPAGMNLAVTVESYSDNGFDPVAGVIVPSLGSPAGNTLKTATFYDNDSGGDRDARVSFTTPQAGTYLLVVTDYAGKTPGCYRYQADIAR